MGDRDGGYNRNWLWLCDRPLLLFFLLCWLFCLIVSD